MNIAHATVAALVTGTHDTEEEDQRCGQRTADVVEIPHRTDDTSRLLVDLDISAPFASEAVSCGVSLFSSVFRNRRPSVAAYLRQWDSSSFSAARRFRR